MKKQTINEKLQQYRRHIKGSYILMIIGAIGILVTITLCYRGWQFVDVGGEATYTRARLDAINNTTRANQDRIDRIIEILNSRDAIIIPKEP